MATSPDDESVSTEVAPEAGADGQAGTSEPPNADDLAASLPQFRQDPRSTVAWRVGFGLVTFATTILAAIAVILTVRASAHVREDESSRGQESATTLVDGAASSAEPMAGGPAPPSSLTQAASARVTDPAQPRGSSGN
jgi:hypothetical protein